MNVQISNGFSNPLHPSVVLPFIVALFTNSTAGQSLSMRRSGESKTWIDANSSGRIGYRLQASGKFHDWADISDQASGPLSYRIDNTGETSRFFRLRTWTIDNAPLTLVLIGDSTVTDFASNLYWFSGWGQGV